MNTMEQACEKFYKREFWATENLKYAEPHFRLEKAVRVVNSLAKGKQYDLLDVGCGPATLARLLDKNIHYYGIDMAIQNPATNLIETDFLRDPISFGDRRFDIILAQGVFEYIGSFQSQKFLDIKRILKPSGTFIASYVNFDHLNKVVYWPYNNVQSFDEFRKKVAEVFKIDRVLPTSHHWYAREPERRLMKSIHMHINVNIPFISPLFAVEYFFICSVSS
jgi:SAM-dependent methyltransferase